MSIIQLLAPSRPQEVGEAVPRSKSHAPTRPPPAPWRALHRAAAQAKSRTELLERACRTLQSEGGFPLVWIGLPSDVGPPQLRPCAVAPPDTALRPMSLAGAPQAPASRALHAAEPQRADLQPNRPRDPGRRAALAAGCRAGAWLPLRGRVRAHGVLALYAAGPAAFEPDRLSSLQAAADALGQALDRLGGATEPPSLTPALESIRRLSAALLDLQDIQALLHTIVEQAAALLGAHAGSLFLAGQEPETVRCVVSHPKPPDYTGMVLRYGEGVAGRVAASGRGMIVQDYTLWHGRAAIAPLDDPVGSVLSVPIPGGTLGVGVLQVWRRIGQAWFTDTDLELLNLFAAQAAVALRHARLIEAGQRRLEQLSRLTAITHAALGVQDPRAFMQRMAELLAELFDADLCLLALQEPDPELASRFPTAVPRRTVQRRVELRLSDLARLEELARTARGPASAIEPPEGVPLGGLHRLPLQAGGVQVGTALLGHRQAHPLTEEQAALADQAAGLVALGLSKILALEAERRRSAELEALRQASLYLTARLEVRPLLQAMLEQTIDLVGADDAHLFLYDGERLTFGAARWAGGAQSEPYANPRPDGLTASVARSGERIVVPLVDEHPLFANWRWGGSIAGFPLRAAGRVNGVMTVAWQTPHRFNDDELRLLDLLADQAAIALENARLFEATAAQQRRVQLLYDISREVSITLDPDEILQRAVDLATASLEGMFGEAFLLEAGSGRLRLRGLAGRDPALLPTLDRTLDARLGQGLVGWIAAQRQAVRLDDVQADGRWLSVSGGEQGIRSALGAPILSGPELLGVLMILHGQPAAFEAGQLDLIAAIARQVGLALSNALRYQQARRRLAELTALQQVGQVVNARLELQPLLDEITRQVREVLGYPIVEVFLIEGDELVLRAFGGSDDPGPQRMTFDQGVVGRAVRENHTVFAPEVERDPDYLPINPGTRAEIVVPLRKRGVVFGVLNVETPHPGALTDDDVRLLSLLADQIAVAVENAALYDHLRAHADALEQTVKERTAKLAEALEHAHQADRVKSRFVSDVSHELRTPLSNIRLYLDLLRTGSGDRFESYLSTLNRETERLIRLIEDLLALSRIDTGATALQRTAVDLNRLALSLVEDRQRLFASKGLDLAFEPQPDLPAVWADERMVGQVVANLLTNAMQYTPAGRVVLATAARQDGALWSTLAVTDTGLGVPPEEQPRLFERFFRGSSSRAVRAPGTGLGLAICREILDRHGGRITLESEVGRGSTFTVWLPAGAPASQPPPEPAP